MSESSERPKEQTHEDALRLTARDLGWLRSLADGMEAKQLEGSTDRGIRARLVRIRAKLGARTTTQAVATAIRKGLI